jgi:hypothetical protein
MPTKPQIADRAEILLLLSDSARDGHVGAMRLLLEELRRDGEQAASASKVIDELATKRRKAPLVV